MIKVVHMLFIWKVLSVVVDFWIYPVIHTCDEVNACANTVYNYSYFNMGVLSVNRLKKNPHKFDNYSYLKLNLTKDSFTQRWLYLDSILKF